MTSTSTLSDAAGKASTLVSNILSSLQASFGPNSAVEGMFTNFLSQYNIQMPPTPQPQASNNQSQSAPNANTKSSGNAGTSSTDSSNTAQTMSGWTQIGHVIRQAEPKTSDTNSSQTNGTGNSGPSKNTNNLANSPSPAGPTPPSGTGVANAASANASPNTNPDDTTNGAASTTSSTNSTTQATATADPTAPTDASSPSANSGTQTADGTQPDVSSELIALILQLERLAVSQSTALQTNASTAATASPNAGTGAVQGTSSDPNGKLDLKGLLAAIAGLNDGSNSTDGQSTNGASATAQTSLDAASSPSLTTPVPSTGAPQAQATSDRLASTDFLSLFGLANNANNAAPPLPVFNPIAGSPLLTDADGDGGSLDTNAQGQNGAGARDAAANLDTSAANTSLTPTTTQASNPYDFASQLSALRAAKGGATGLPTPVEQVVLQLSRGLNKDGDSQMTIQLKPAELGRVEVKLNIASDGKVQGTVTADNSTTLGLLLKDSGGLERALQEAGLRADPGSLQFSLRGDGQSGQTFGQQAGNQSGSGTDGSLDSSTTMSGFADPGETYYLTPGGVNMRV